MFWLQYVATGCSVELVHCNFIVFSPCIGVWNTSGFCLCHRNFYVIQLEVTRSNLQYRLGMCLRKTATNSKSNYFLTALGYLHMVWSEQMLLYAHVCALATEIRAAVKIRPSMLCLEQLRLGGSQCYRKFMIPLLVTGAWRLTCSNFLT